MSEPKQKPGIKPEERNIRSNDELSESDLENVAGGSPSFGTSPKPPNPPGSTTAAPALGDSKIDP